MISGLRFRGCQTESSLLRAPRPVWFGWFEAVPTRGVYNQVNRRRRAQSGRTEIHSSQPFNEDCVVVTPCGIDLPQGICAVATPRGFDLPQGSGQTHQACVVTPCVDPQVGGTGPNLGRVSVTPCVADLPGGSHRGTSAQAVSISAWLPHSRGTKKEGAATWTPTIS